jgi:organic hydroperoxide reductase OsmC/OhrA
MPVVKAKVLEYELELDREGSISAPGDTPHRIPPELTAEHLVLAGLARCTLTSLGYHGRRAAVAVAGSAARVSGRVTKRDTDGRYAFVAIDVRLDVELQPPPDPAGLAELLAKAERDCFVGASLTAPPRYVWRVNGADVQ